MLVKVGYYTATELTPPTPQDPREDEVVQAIMADQTLTEAERAKLVDIQLKRMRDDQARRHAEYEELAAIFRASRNAS
jgi:hypothetical protein